MNKLSLPARRRSRLAKAGYSAVEVLLAMTVFSVGAAAVISMERAVVQGNVDARRLDVANSIARLWIDRLVRDGIRWTTPSLSVSTSNLSSTTWLKNINPSTPVWLWPGYATCAGGACNAGSFPESAAFDFLGRELQASETSKAVFCANYRLEWLDSPSPGDPTTNALMRAEVRVFWLRQLAVAPTQAANTFCDGTMTDVSSNNANRIFQFVYLTTAIRRNLKT